VTTYFVATATADVALVPKALRGHDDLETIATQAERDVVEQFTRQGPPDTGNASWTWGWGSTTWDWSSSIAQGYNKGNGFWVHLAGYTPDADDCEDVDLKAALKDTIAAVIAWRLARTAENAMVFTSVSTQAGLNKTFRDDVNSPFPPGDWAFRLKRWDRRLPVYHI
jgi:hypothetical protein